jgi:hypothetical protein
LGGCSLFLSFAAVVNPVSHAVAERPSVMARALCFRRWIDFFSVVLEFGFSCC